MRQLKRPVSFAVMAVCSAIEAFRIGRTASISLAIGHNIRMFPFSILDLRQIVSPFDGDFITCTEENPVSAQVPAEMGVDVGVCVALQVASERPAFET